MPSRTCCEQGHRRIAIVADSHGLYTAGERLAGYARAFERAGLTPAPELISMGHSTWESAHAAVLQLLELPPELRPTAIFAANNRCTVGAMHALHGGDQDVALVGFDEFELADLLGVTVVRTDPYRIGQVAAQLAFSRIDGDERPPAARDAAGRPDRARERRARRLKGARGRCGRAAQAAAGPLWAEA